MSTPSVRSTIQQAMKTRSQCDSALVTAREGGKIVAEAEKGPVTVGEAKLIGDLYDRGVPQPAPGSAMTRMCPEHGADSPLIAAGAYGKMDAFFVRHDLPLGKNAANLRTDLLAFVETHDLGAPLDRAPSTAKRLPVVLRDDRPVDGAKLTAWYDPKDKTFYVESQAYSRMTAGEIRNFYGPFDNEPRFHTLAIPENPGDMSVTLAIPENPGDDVAVLPAE